MDGLGEHSDQHNPSRSSSGSSYGLSTSASSDDRISRHFTEYPTTNTPTTYGIKNDDQDGIAEIQAESGAFKWARYQEQSAPSASESQTQSTVPFKALTTVEFTPPSVHFRRLESEIRAVEASSMSLVQLQTPPASRDNSWSKPYTNRQYQYNSATEEPIYPTFEQHSPSSSSSHYANPSNYQYPQIYNHYGPPPLSNTSNDVILLPPPVPTPLSPQPRRLHFDAPNIVSIEAKRKEFNEKLERILSEYTATESTPAVPQSHLSPTEYAKLVRLKRKTAEQQRRDDLKVSFQTLESLLPAPRSGKKQTKDVLLANGKLWDCLVESLTNTLQP
ncbi:hypothetical protein BCR33DRAFT_351760 [Rhizoclosmatium globosum]|uniref:BHLH domain-containing protein n=1 Tax=Rhizoclosmatium globosum TaxID=329046 RepID=A0A1Y2C1W8_9FUNG|nr:hypothetical protein BCR33DRAFT_351760 [Rhizoclosmatium globosum]|eukprot:ORY41028.1 hypothetical protein BCR33DRAFT_351760 [Rhizoclosmatium globosum]